MTRSRQWAVLVTVAIIFVIGVIVGMWLTRGTEQVTPPPPVASTPARYEPLDSSEAVVMRVYEQLSPAVVNIVATSLSLNFWMQPVPQEGQGTGFVIDHEGHILTNNHVVANAQNLEAAFMGGHKVQAKLVGRDTISDLAVIKVSPFPGMASAPLGDSDRLSVGQRVIAIGNPFGFQHTVTAGFISALNRDLNIGGRTLMGMIQTDAAINPGNSGGPLISSQGEVVAVNTAIYTQSGGFMGIGLAVPINRAKKVAKQLIKWGRAIYPWIGLMSGMDINAALAREMGLPAVNGVLIFQLTPNGPAAKAGIKGGNQLRWLMGKPILLGGDVIISVDQTPTATFEELEGVIRQKTVGEAVRLGIVRGRQQLEVEVVTVPAPSSWSQPM